ncbi:MAG: ribosome small subunit-dependent GTPase A [Betaproteobacteria bacterium]|nr:ribosome small subunit-dependent GTPase A [Betaproteobacteria bacterium]
MSLRDGVTPALSNATVVAGYGRKCLAQLDSGELLHCQMRGRHIQPVCGDRVQFAYSSVDQGVIEAVAPRTNEFSRAVHYRRKVVAANFSQVVILVACEPSFSDELICRMLVVAEQANLPTVIVLNKFDLVEQRDRALAMLGPFRGLGYPLLELAGKIDVEPLRPYLAGHRSLLTGQSGMGKSTLVNALVPDAEAKIREISAFLDAGKQTTTGSRLYPVAPGTEIIDSPGLAEFGLAGMDYLHILEGFHEFAPYRGQCRFQNCRHINEPGCAVQTAASGAIHPRRLLLYQRIVLAEESSGPRR